MIGQQKITSFFVDDLYKVVPPNDSVQLVQIAPIINSGFCW